MLGGGARTMAIATAARDTVKNDLRKVGRNLVKLSAIRLRYKSANKARNFCL